MNPGDHVVVLDGSGDTARLLKVAPTPAGATGTWWYVWWDDPDTWSTSMSESSLRLVD